MNIDIKKYLKKLIAMGALSFALVTTGCSSKENNAEPTNEITTEVENNNEQENTTNDNDTQETENNNTEETTEDSEIVKYFEDKNEEINNLIYTENFEKADEVWGDYFIDAIDFIFYDKEYKDTKFADLNPEAQQKCIDELKEVENKINKINPNWKEDLGNIKDSTAEAYSNLLDIIEELIGTDNYNKIKNIKDNIKNNLIDSANDWYQGYKSNHQK